MSDTADRCACKPADPCKLHAGAEPCERCYVPRNEHGAVKSHDYEPIFLYACAACGDDLVYDSDTRTQHPDYDHDFDPVPAPLHTVPPNATDRCAFPDCGEVLDDDVQAHLCRGVHPPHLGCHAFVPPNAITETKFMLVCARCGYRIAGANPEMLLCEAEELHDCDGRQTQ
ncbi:MAG: hypothetical protein KGL39_34400 [Patescibacteria group bacterium]|nr:hypothetical protein [Patescibacteria group bacterium]